MQGVLLESGSVDHYLALGKSGHPVSDAAQQILAVLKRYPQLQPFFAIPQRNQNGSVIDWYSPIHGNVIPWANASDAEKEQARQALEAFTQSVQNLGAQHIQNAAKNGNNDAGLFGQLLQEACKIPSASNIYLVEVEGAKNAAPTGQTAAALASGNAVGSGANEQSMRLQPVLTFWGFVNHEADRHRKPLYFLEPIPLPPEDTPGPGEDGVGEKRDTTTKLTPKTGFTKFDDPQKQQPPTGRTPQPWWKNWRMWLLFALLLLLLLWLLRGCVPTAKLPGIPSVGLPNVQLPSLPSGKLPEANLPTIELPQGGVAGALPEMPQLPVGQVGLEGASSTPVGTVPALETGAQLANSLPAAGMEPPILPNTPMVPEGGATSMVPPVLPETPALPGAEPAVAAPAALEMPSKAADGVADFLNGKYRTHGGLVDKDTAQPLHLQYDFQNGKGQVEIQRPNGVSCKADALASMKAGQLGIQTQGSAQCSDGSVYDMPQVQCTPGATSAADCAGVYDNRQFPIQMRKN